MRHSILRAVLSFCCALAIASASPLMAQTLDPYSSGKRYLLAFPATAGPVGIRYYSEMNDVVAVLVYSAVKNEVRITGNGFDRTVQLQAGVTESISLVDVGRSAADALVTTSEKVSDRTYRLEARDPVVVYCYMATRNGGEMWTPIPVERWGKDYIVASMPGEVIRDSIRTSEYAQGGVRKPAPAVVTIVAGYDNTSVTIYPSNPLVTPPTIKLNANQAYQIFSAVNVNSTTAQSDIAGTRIIATKPIGVLSGNTRAQVSTLTAMTGNSLKNLMIEWLSPVEQFGTEFVFVPTWDSRKLGPAKSTTTDVRRATEYVRVYGAASPGTSIRLWTDSTTSTTSNVLPSAVAQFQLSTERLHRITTDKPVQAVLHSTASFKRQSSGGSANHYDTWGPYMMELVPREQWTSFAPYFAPRYPYLMQHYITVVADTSAFNLIFDQDGSPFDFTFIPGTHLMWGTMQVPEGTTRYIKGEEGARFWAYAFGLRPGVEHYLSRGEGYREDAPISYGYPLAPQRRILRPADSLAIDTVRTTCGLRISIRAINTDPVGLESVSLENGSLNASMIPVVPSGTEPIIGVASAQVTVQAVDPQQDASATIVITDRTGRIWRIPFTHIGERVDFGPARLFDFGEVNVGTTSDSMMVITNSSERSICIRQIRMQYADQGITIKGTEPSGPAQNPPATVTLAPGEELRVQLSAWPVSKDRIYLDSLRVELCCSEQKMAVRVGAAVPCIHVEDLDFGLVRPEETRTMYLRICNEGGGVATFEDGGSGAAVLEWLVENFTVEPTWLDSLRRARLGAGACTSIPVTFNASEPGEYNTVARLHTNTEECRDSSIWRAVVTEDISGVELAHREGYAMEDIRPNPSDGGTEISFRLAAAGHTTVEIYTMIGERVALLVDRPLRAGRHTIAWDASVLPAGIYYCRALSGEWREGKVIMVR